MEAKIRSDWAALQAWQEKVDLDGQLKLLKQEL